MTSPSQPFQLAHPNLRPARVGVGEIAVASVLSALLALVWAVSSSPFLPIVVAAAPAALVVALSRPALAVVGFTAVACFRIPEAFPALEALKLQLAFGALATLGLLWQMAGRTLAYSWPAQLQLNAGFFLLTTFGISFALSPSIALAFWSETVVKLFLFTLALSWTVRRPSDFRLCNGVLVLSGILIAITAIGNKMDGIGLVEQTRVTIGRELGSVLGDPNDLAYVLLLPLSFSLALMAYRPSVPAFLLGGAGVCTIVPAITFTQSRGALAGILTIVAAFGVRFVRRRSALCFAWVAVALVLYLAMDIGGRSSGGELEEGFGEAAAIRIDLWNLALHVSASRPLTGVGLRNFPLVSLQQTGSAWVAHNTWMEVASEIGLPGLAVFGAMVITATVSAFRADLALMGEKTLQVTAFGAGAGLVGCLVSASFLSEAFTWPLWALVALTSAVRIYASERRPDHTPEAANQETQDPTYFLSNTLGKAERVDALSPPL